MAASASLTEERARRARSEPLRAERIAPGMFLVENIRSGSEHTADARDLVCDCEDYQYRMSQIEGGRCKHLEYLKQIDEGVLCPSCGYRICRPSCPKRGEQ